ncbi:TetR family transcriptional regulator [Nocardioides nitrophenolicus]|uniref:TetR family transcriptional regulator n=1 Tax=Nocardioides nitrophenolicus TaxID=60489 RepID=UPI001959A823|nr:TetR family transcriptional regulator [Nocardioides nitrophenolicus]MBM7519488.1 TetR/AcrR family tetracycline transcriptional repressor [Nocardioides nitrophenolicus]
MRYRRDDVVARAIEVLDAHGLDALSMRRLAGDLGVQPGALYHHFTNKDALLAAIADEILRRGRRPAEIMAWDAEVQLLCLGLRDAMRRHRDGAVLIAQVNRADSEALERPLREAIERAGADADLARVGARALLRYVLAHEDVTDPDFARGLDLLLSGLRARLV